MPQIHVAVTRQFLQEFEEACRRLNFASKSEALRWAIRNIISQAKQAAEENKQ